MEFIGRKNELKSLADSYSSERYEGIVIYGRRRIGKSKLITESYKNIDCVKIYYQCTKSSEETNAYSLSEEIGKALHIPTPSFKSLDEALIFLFTYSLKEKLILVLDEYPYIRDDKFALDSRLQKIIDKFKDASRMKLILCGSYIDVMENILSDENPLFGRITYKLQIKQMNYYDSSLFYPSFSSEDKLRLYSVFGGIPYYNQFVNENKSVKENIIELIASQNARLLSEAESFLTSEIKKLDNANEAFAAIARGNKKFSDILNRSHVTSSPTLSDVLKKLISIEAVEKSNPINDEAEKKSIYTIKDRLSLFYFTYIFRNLSSFMVMPSEAFYDEFIEEDFETKYVPMAFELVSREYFERMNLENKIKPVLYKIGTYYYDDPKRKLNGEFDVVTLDKYGYKFYECKFTNGPIDDTNVLEEERQISYLAIGKVRLGFISKNGFNLSEPKDYDYLTLEDLYKN